uniref:Inhibitor of growth protein n=1 Tax=Cacopsylla melanoneura TaxID=428564 RepID=A0A8D9DWE8_9HEMI
MLNQAVLEAMYSVPYVETYLDVVENLPDEIQRYLTKIRELDVSYHAYMKEIETIAAQQANNEDNTTFRKRNLFRVQVALIAAQEIGDEKLSILQQVQDIIENKTRQLDGIFCDLPFTKAETAKKEQDNGDANSKNEDKKSSDNKDDAEPPKKRTRRKRAEIEAAEQAEHTTSTPLPRSTATIEVPKKSAAAAETPVKKRKRKSKQAEKDVSIDPNDPTFCLCNQVSFGQMVMCDNDSCTIEWFHFSCVGITNTPKGKWYCPDCRKARTSTVRPKK